MARKTKGGDLTDALWTGTAVYAANNSTSFGGFLWSFAKYALIIIGILVGVSLVILLISKVAGKEKFVPSAPSEEGDKKVMTPAGNVIMY